MIDTNKHIIVLSPPKTASNSIRVLLEQFGFIFSNNVKTHNHPQIHLKLSEIVNQYNIDNLEDYKILQITRNPYERYISSFYFLKKIIPKDYTPKFKNYELDSFTEHLIDSKFSNNFIESFYGDNSFVDYCISNGINWGGSRLFDTQIGWNDLGVDVKYFKLEKITKDIKPLSDFLGLNFNPLPRINSQDLSIDYLSMFSSHTKEYVMSIFEDDFEFLGYKK